MVGMTMRCISAANFKMQSLNSGDCGGGAEENRLATLDWLTGSDWRLPPPVTASETWLLVASSRARTSRASEELSGIEKNVFTHALRLDFQRIGEGLQTV